MHIEVLAVGTELLLGQTINGNAAWLGARLAEEGHEVVAHHAVGDDQAMIVAALRLAMGRSDVVIVTGGLGPTADDLTREAIAAAVGVGLDFDDELARRLAERWESRFGSEIPVSNFRQAEYPEGADPLPNPKGTAPGIWLETEQAVVVALPGVPREMEGLFDGEVVPRLRRRAGWVGRRVVRVIRTWGLPESTVGERLEDVFVVDGNPSMALLASEAEIKVRLVADADTDAEARALIAPVEAVVVDRLGAAVFGYDEDTVERRIHALLGDRGWTVAVAESLTAGLVSHRLTSPPGSSDVVKGGMVVYATETKVSLLGVDADLIERAGVVSEPVAEAMAAAVAERMSADVGLSLTGVAGPGPAEGIEPGTVVVAMKSPEGSSVRTIRLPGDRERVRRYAATAALHHLRRALEAG